jgi:hypothetical protein
VLRKERGMMEEKDGAHMVELMYNCQWATIEDKDTCVQQMRAGDASR